MLVRRRQLARQPLLQHHQPLSQPHRVDLAQACTGAINDKVRPRQQWRPNIVLLRRPGDIADRPQPSHRGMIIPWLGQVGPRSGIGGSSQWARRITGSAKLWVAFNRGFLRQCVTAMTIIKVCIVPA
jgi:hypothetical protein